jgi:hypothetical protein
MFVFEHLLKIVVRQNYWIDQPPTTDEFEAEILKELGKIEE